VNGELQPHRQLEVLARDHCRRRETANDLLGDVRAGENGHGTPLHERREPFARCRVEAFRQAEDGRRAGQRRHDLSEHRAWHRDGDELHVGERRVGEGGRLDAPEIGVANIARVPARLRDCGRLLRVAGDQRDVVSDVSEKTRERRAPRAGAHDGYAHEPPQWSRSVQTRLMWT
jgi:hypothetical protein